MRGAKFVPGGSGSQGTGVGDQESGDGDQGSVQGPSGCWGIGPLMGADETLFTLGRVNGFLTAER